MEHSHQHSCSFPSVDPIYTSDPAHLPPKHSDEYEGVTALKTIEAATDSLSSGLRDVSLKMHGTPELAWKEYKTSDLLAAFMQSQGFTVKRKAYGTDTGFEAVYAHGEGGKVIGFNSEMDALPAIGHACGHNLIAIAGMGAAVATAQAMAKHNVVGKVILLATPAEESDGGKCLMLKNGAYKDMDVCLMAHPTPLTGLAPMLAVTECLVEFFGHTAHAGGAPWEGVNALDAAVLAYQSIAVLRQQIHPLHRVHGVIMGSEEWACNVIPGHSKLKFGVRHPELSEVLKLKGRIEKCFAAAAEATGCTHKVEWVMQYSDMHNNSILAGEFKRYMEDEQGWHVPIVKDSFGSTDFGDVTYALPALHPLYAIPVPSRAAANHTAGFEKASATPEAHENTMKVAKGLAATAWRILSDEKFAAAAQHEYETVRKPKNVV